MLSVILVLLTIVSINISTIYSLLGEKKNKHRRIIRAGSYVAIFIVLLQAFITYKDGIERDKEKADQISRFENLNTQHESLQTQNKILNEKIDVLTTENQKLRDTIAHPVLEYYKDGFRMTKDDTTGKYKSSYVYRSERPSVGIRDVKIELEFDKPILKAISIERKTEGGILSENRKEAVFDNGTYKIECGIKELKEGCELIIEVLSNEPLAITTNKYSP